MPVWTTAGWGAGAVVSATIFGWEHAQPPKVIPMMTTNNKRPKNLFLMVYPFIRFIAISNALSSISELIIKICAGKAMDIICLIL